MNCYEIVTFAWYLSAFFGDGSLVLERLQKFWPACEIFKWSQTVFVWFVYDMLYGHDVLQIHFFFFILHNSKYLVIKGYQN